MKCLLTICLFILFSCNSGNNTPAPAGTDQKLPSPLKENPEVDAIPEDMEIKNDSDVMPNPAVADTIPMIDTPRMDRERKDRK